MREYSRDSMIMKKKIALFMFLFILALHIASILETANVIYLSGGASIRRHEGFRKFGLQKEVQVKCSKK